MVVSSKSSFISFIIKEPHHKIAKENTLHTILTIIDFFHETFNQYFIIVASDIATKNSQTIIYDIQSHIINGSTNHNNGSVTVVGITQNKSNFLFDISFLSHHISSIIPYFLQ